MVRTRRSRRQSEPRVSTSATLTSTNNVVEDVNIDSSDTEVETPPKSVSTKSKPKLQIFKGNGDKVSIENWLKRFEMLAKFYEWTESDQVVMLGNYLEDDAMNWYIENVNDYNYKPIKIKLMTRFGLETVEPIVDFVNTKYDTKQGIKEYFETKRRLGAAASLTEEQMIPLLIQGLHSKMIEYFTAVKPKTFAEFYSIAKTAENNFKRITFKTNDSFKPKPKTTEPNNGKQKRKPPNPCIICDKLGFKNRFHWGNECRNRGKTQTQNQTNVKTINTVSNFSENTENDISNIDLN